MIEFCEATLRGILQLNNAFHLSLMSAKQIVFKLSKVTMRDKFWEALNDLRDRERDTYGIRNYITTLQRILELARMETDEKLEVIQMNKLWTKTRDNVNKKTSRGQKRKKQGNTKDSQRQEEIT